ncbi:unnamed protein product [Acanthoscelides obtectus]|uniref:Sphingomyelin phosphodiesterase n=2 Tax=Acanthoscelides obtectus TaxID=200917 RepID=A0A9P0KKM6_ACAOB|nr:unnamed protein product [Acanthoscelides obtectus]CAK1654531.1 Sphingomyelin phosphodiesterase 1 [Acanthoscelides obtectus]
MQVIAPFLFLALCATIAICSENDGLERVRDTLKQLEVGEKLPRSIYKDTIAKLSNEKFCQACHEVVKAIIKQRKMGSSKDSMNDFLRKMCNLYTEYGTTACKGYTEINLDVILYIIDNKHDLTPERVCAIFHQAKKCVDPKAKKWIIDIPPASHNENSDEQNEVPIYKIWNVLQITDVHYDPLYKENTQSVCNKPLCCQDGTPTKPEEAAGKWGDYHVCDSPPRLFSSLYERVKSKHLDSLDAVYFTGDIISHKSWSTSKASNIADIKGFYKALYDTFKGKGVFPILGNHEGHPVDCLSPESVTDSNLSTKWLFEEAWNAWSKWLPGGAEKTVKHAGYYSVLVKPGFRIIGINSNFCFVHNLWLFYEDEDPYGQLAWLVQELLKAEKNHEKVHILSHVPSGHELCHLQWSKNYRMIVERFNDTIGAQFNGHTHIDEIEVFYPEGAETAVNVAFNGGSLTPFIGNNPNYKMYQIKLSDATVQDYQTYTFNMTEANKDSSPEWYELYSFKQAYGLQDLSKKSLTEFVQKLNEDKTLQQKYFEFTIRNSDMLVNAGCDDKCMKTLTCKVTAVEAGDALDKCYENL